MRKPVIGIVATAGFISTLVVGPIQAHAQNDQTSTGSQTYVVVAKDSASAAAAAKAATAAGAKVVSTNDAIGTITVKAGTDFANRMAGSSVVEGVARNRSIGQVPADATRKRDAVEKEARSGAATSGRTEIDSPDAGTLAPEPLADLQWDMKLIGATAEGSYAINRGSRAVTVGIIDTGVDGKHPDIAPNFDKLRSRNFVTDDPALDGHPCTYASCVDPVDEDDDGHGTHVAGTIGAPLNGFGMAGVAPDVTLVNIRAGQDSGFFLLSPTLNALTYAGQAGIDVVNMSFFIDPWLFNCTANPADSPQDQAEQRTIITATQRALNYAHRRNVTLVAALGNEHSDLGNPGIDTISPDFPSDVPYPRTIDNATCLTLPTEGNHVISVSSIGPSGRKAYYSNYGTEQTDVAAPGGDFRDFFGTDKYRTVENLVLAPYPMNVGLATGSIDPTTGDVVPNTADIIKHCVGTTCAYYQWIQGTSMASPHAAGVAALIVSRYGEYRGPKRGLELKPDETAAKLFESAQQTPCPATEPFTYPDRPVEYNAMCDGTPEFNGFFGHGVVDALRAVSGGEDNSNGNSDN